MDQRSRHPATPPTYEHELALLRAARARAYRALCRDGASPHEALPASRDGLFELKAAGDDVAAVPVCPDCFATGRVPFSERVCPFCKGTGLAQAIGGAA